MKANDFMYDGITLSEKGFVLCSFGDKGLNTVSNGVEISFNTVSVQNGAKQHRISTVYEDVLTTTFQICKNGCFGNDMEISSIEFRELTRWLNRKKFLKLKILDGDYIDVYYEASFINISRIEIDGKLYGVELELITNRPFACKEPKIINIRNKVKNGKHSINDTSHEEGHIYPYMEIKIFESGDLNIHNAIENRDTEIKNCIAGEVITMDYPIITSSDVEHNKIIQNDFNYEFFRIANTYGNSRNDLTISIPCEIKIKYSPIIKVGL